jgi:tetratricopeptide (TPR) repeat protein
MSRYSAPERVVPHLLLFFCFCAAPGWAERQSVEKHPLIDVQSYTVDVELLPATHQIKAKATLSFKVQEPVINQVSLDFNSNLKLTAVYLTNNPPVAGSKSAAVPGTRESDVPVLTRNPKKKTPPSQETLLKESAPDSALLKFFQYHEDNTLEVDLPAPLQKDQLGSLTFEYAGTLDSSANSPVEGIQTAYVGDEISYLLLLSRWFPINQYLEDRATGQFKVTVPKGFVVAMDGVLRSKETISDKEVFNYSVERESFPGSLSAARYNEIKSSAGPIEVIFFVRDQQRDFINAHAETIGKIAETFTERFGFFPKQIKIALLDNKSLLGYSAPGMEFLAERAFQATPNGLLLARELSYQYWQHLITPKTSADLWLKEGFSSYSGLLYIEKISSEAGFAKELRDAEINALLHEDKTPIHKADELALFSPEYNSILKSKGAFVLHMLRGVLGDEPFFKLMKQYIYDFGYKKASIEDFKKLAEKISEKNLNYFFAQWIDQTGIPKFEYSFTTWRVKDGFRVTGTVKQDLDTFRSPIELLVETEGKPEMKTIEVVGAESEFSVTTFGKPKKVRLDPNNKVLSITEDTGLAVQIAKGDELRKFGQPSDAIAEYQKATEIKKRCSIAFFRMGEVFLEQKSYQSAANSFREALNGDLDPKWIEVWAHINLGKVFDLLGQRERALREYQQAVDTNDNNQNAQEEAQKLIQSPYQEPQSDKIIR